MTTTLETLLKRFDSPTVPLVDIAQEFLGLSARKARELAAKGTLPVPAFRLGSQKSPYQVHVEDLAKLIDQRADDARRQQEFQRQHG
jgi:hypothetical protein